MRRLVFDRAIEPRKGSSLLDFALDSGLHALVGLPPDGTLSLATLASGISRPRTGRVIVDGRDPYVDPALRARIGATLDVPMLPESGTVEQLFRITRDAPSPSTLDTLGLPALSTRRLLSLSPGEERAVELALALATPDPLALVLTEPFAALPGPGRAAFVDSLANAAKAGACVVVVTASVADATDLGGLVHLFEAGRISRTLEGADAFALPGRDVELRVITSGPRALAFELSRHASVSAVSWDADRGPAVSVRGPNLERAALAVAEAALSASAHIVSMTPVPPSLDELRAASAGLALAAYHAAYQYGVGVPASPPSASGSSSEEAS